MSTRLSRHFIQQLIQVFMFLIEKIYTYIIFQLLFEKLISLRVLSFEWEETCSEHATYLRLIQVFPSAHVDVL